MGPVDQEARSLSKLGIFFSGWLMAMTMFPRLSAMQRVVLIRNWLVIWEGEARTARIAQEERLTMDRRRMGREGVTQEYILS